MTDVIKRNIFENIEKTEVLDELIKIFGKNNVTDKPHDLYPYSYDMTEAEPHMPDFVVIPENVEQIVKLNRYCNQYSIPIVPYTSGNNVGGLTIPQYGGIICDMGKKMNKIVKINDSLMYAILEPGVTFGQLEAYLKKYHPNLKYGYAYAPPYASVVSNVLLSGLTNLSCSYGGMADWINGLEVVLNNGDIVRTGSCFISKEFKDNNWFVRYPIPDLSGLFIGWQGMTGIVTKAAVQLWPKKEFNTALLAIVYGSEACAELIREFGRTECCEDVSAVPPDVVKMTFGILYPEKHEEEPDWAIIVSISGHTRELMEAKVNYVKQVFEKVKKKNNYHVLLTNFGTFVNILGKEFSIYYDLPNVITPLYEWDGCTWVGSYANTTHLGPLMEKCYNLFKEYGIGPIVYMKSMKSSHYAIFRPIIRYHKGREENKVKELQHKFLDVML
ncbi:MAG: FAD-binding oxidoreductase, partial [Promethearchaeota archaeon]